MRRMLKPGLKQSLRTLLLLWSMALLIPIQNLPAQKIPLTNYTIQNGLPQNVVNSVCQDETGYVWFATQAGAARFDGYDFKYYTVANGLPSNHVNCILSARDGSIWFGTEGGIASLQGTVFRQYDEDCGLVNNKVDRLEEDLRGNIWACTAYGLSVISPDTIVSYTRDDALRDNQIDDIFVDSRGRVHVATSPRQGLTVFEDLHHYTKESTEEIITDIIEAPDASIWYATQGSEILREKEGSWSKMGIEQGLTDNIILSLLADGKGRIWCGTYVDGIFVYEDGHFLKVESEEGFEPLAKEIHEDSRGRIWIVDYQSGVWLRSKSRFRNITRDNNLANDVVTDFTEDRFGNVWIGTISGVSKYGRVLFEVYDSDWLSLDMENDVTAVFLDSRDRLWFSPYGSLMYMKNGQGYLLDEKRSGFEPGTVVLSFAESSNGNIYIGTDKGLLRYNNRSLSLLTYWGEKSTDMQLSSLDFAGDGSLWCGTDMGLYIIRDYKVYMHHGKKTLLDVQVNAIEHTENMVYCATDGGVSVFEKDGKHLMNYTSGDGLASDFCNDLISDGNGNIWVATDLGLSLIEAGGTVTSFAGEEGASPRAVYFMELVADTSLWLGTERGLIRYNIPDGTGDYYGIDDGFYPLETFDGAVAKGPANDLWMGTVAGLVYYSPEFDIKDTMAPKLVLYPPFVEGKPYHLSEEKGSGRPTFPYNKNSIEFSFTGIHTTIPEKNSFEFMLEGYDENWSGPGIERSATYKRIPNGDYEFRVRAYNLDGVETAREARFSFTIKPPFWKTPWFIMFVALAGLLMVFGIIKYRERQLVKEKRILESRVKERTREIEDQKVEIEAQRDEIFDQNKEITASIHYAKHIQQAVLPGKLSLERMLPEHFILFRPRDIVSGDFYWVEQKNERIIICAADCTGHGVPGAFMSLLGLTFLNEIVNKDGILKASEILNRLREYIIRAMSHKDRQARDGMDVSLLVIDRQLNILEYAGAYNPLLVIREGEMMEYKADKMPVGKHEGEEKAFTNHRISLEDGDQIYLFSDGFPDQFGGAKGGKYKARPFKRFLQSNSKESMARQEALLDRELKDWMGAGEQVDDILVMGIKYDNKPK